MKSKISITILIFLMIAASTFAQQLNPVHKPMSKEDSAAINALVLYPDTIRTDIFEACMYPAAIINIAALQKNSSTQFNNLIAGYSKNEQEDFYNLSRYPGLISKLVQGGRKPDDQLNLILLGYPNDIRETAMKNSKDKFETLQNIDNIQQQTNAQFEQIISEYPPVTQEALRELIQLPEIISILNDHLELTVRVGDRYRKDPQHVIHKADSANLAEVRQQAEDLAEWKQNIKDNPDDANDLKNAANDYAQENGYSQEEVNTAPNPDYVNNYTCYPYSYWFGYPGWYPYSYWYPYPYWFDCGFYYDAFGNLIIIGMPSYYFTYWYFYYPEHWHRYPHLCNHYINHYYRPRGGVNENSVIVHRWVNDNRRYLPKDFIENKSTRVQAIKEVGQLHVDVQKQIGNKTVTNEEREKYFDKAVAKYPTLNKSKEENIDKNQPTINNKEEKQTSFPDYYKEQPTKQPPVKISKPEQTTTQPQPTQKQPAYDFNKINKAQEYHKNTWQQTQPTYKPQQTPQPQQTPRQQPSPQPVRQTPSNPPTPKHK